MEHTVFWPGWETVRLIGRGSFGAVYEIQRTLFGEVEKAALKVITIPQNASDIEIMRSEGFDEESITNAFRDHLKSIVAEYSFMRKMNGSINIVNCDDIRYVQHDDGIGWDIYIKMELLTPLTKALPDAIPEDIVIRIARDLCSALESCKKYNIVHRDIKPQNIFVSDEGNYKLGDFGIAKTVEKTMGGTKIGTYKYMAPEVYNNQPYGSAADIYSLGLVLYWMLNERRMPFLPLPPAKLSAKMDEDARTRRLAGESIPAPKHGSEELKRIVLKACAYDPKERYTDASQMREDIDHLANGATVLAVPAHIPPAETESYAEDATVLDEVCRKRKTSQSGVSIQPSVVSETTPDARPAWQQVSAVESQPTQSKKRTGGSYLQEQHNRKIKRLPVFLLLFLLCGVIVAGWFVAPRIWTKNQDSSVNIHSEGKTREEESSVIELPEEEQNRAQQPDDAITPGNTGSGTFSSTNAENIQALTETEETVPAEQPHVHSWVDATCTTPKTCYTCGEISGSALGHQWIAATCTAPRTCSLCGETSGSALGHQWLEATCTEPKTCSVCGATTGGALGHQWIEATYDAPRTCMTCGESVGDSLGYPLTWCREIENSNNPNARNSVDIEVGTWRDKFGIQYPNSIKYWLSASLVATEYSVYDIGAKYSKLSLTVVNAEKNADGGENQVTIYADGVIIYQSDWIRNDSLATVVTLNVTGVNRLKIEATTRSYSYCYCLVSGELYK